MKKHMLAMVSLVLALVFAVTTLSAYAQEKPVTVKGVVEAAVKDQAGNISAVQIAVGAEKYTVADNPKAKELIKLVGKTVEATGMVKAKQDGGKLIAIDSFKVIQ